jgi:predicted RNase H-like HicB family nuclease
MSKYEIDITWSSIDQAYIATVPELPGCMADGTSYAEALVNVQIIMDEWIETAKALGRKIPLPGETEKTVSGIVYNTTNQEYAYA